MTNKIKVFVGFLALIALFSVYSFFNSFDSSSPITKTANILNNSLSFEVDSDADHDGLTNREESYWNTDFQNPDTDGDGFKDGEEVASRHDPLIPGPNDLLDNGNLTNKLSKLTLSGLYEGSLRPDSPNYDKSLNDMALAVMDDATNSLSSKIDPTKFQVVGSSKENQEIYLKEISVLFEDFLQNYGDEIKNLQKYLELIGSDGFENKNLIIFFQTKENNFQRIFNTGYSLNIPRNWIQEHAYFLYIVKVLQVVSQSIAQGSDDPVKASVALNTLGDIFENLPKLLGFFTDKIKSENLDSPFFKSLMQ